MPKQTRNSNRGCRSCQCRSKQYTPARHGTRHPGSRILDQAPGSRIVQINCFSQSAQSGQSDRLDVRGPAVHQLCPKCANFEPTVYQLRTGFTPTWYQHGGNSISTCYSQCHTNFAPTLCQLRTNFVPVSNHIRAKLVQKQFNVVRGGRKGVGGGTGIGGRTGGGGGAGNE